MFFFFFAGVYIYIYDVVSCHHFCPMSLLLMSSNQQCHPTSGHATSSLKALKTPSRTKDRCFLNL